MNSRQLRDLIMQHENVVREHGIAVHVAVASKSDKVARESMRIAQSHADKMIDSRERLIAAFDSVVSR